MQMVQCRGAGSSKMGANATTPIRQELADVGTCRQLCQRVPAEHVLTQYWP
ncbi:hypothetical protein IF1G_04186 [Cordyceps javanica]|uniref:Uncharacterized protein n=1 Tax=Cordyceps javanica TaxID=43265 RepID=A0A545V5G3_9HYPO|nr:hypothetical protein IF1G_04186 [Cordyceps javanica]TQW08203.1 hypothetical protein IF2G_04079 [Cordyceps javanica]